MSTDLHPSLAALPNAVHIARVLASLKANPKAWAAAWTATRDTAWADAWGAAWDTARNAASAVALNAAWTAARNAAWGPARAPAWDAAWGPARAPAWGTLLALIARDDSARLLSLTPDQLQAHHMVTEDPAAVLLMPAVMVFAQEAASSDPDNRHPCRLSTNLSTT